MTAGTVSYCYVCELLIAMFLAQVHATLALVMLMHLHFSCVHDAGNTLYMPVATSISSLIQKTVDELKIQHAPKTLEEAEIQVPSPSWVSLQFCPKNPLPASALNYTGTLNLTHQVQQRILRASSVDSHYVAAAYKYMRSYGLWLHEQLVEANSGLSVISASCDDKCKVMLSSFAIVAMYVFATIVVVAIIMCW